MAVPSHEKTWQFIPDVRAVEGSEDAYNKRTLFNIKETLIGFPTNAWQVASSCDGTNYGNNDYVDRWLDVGDLVYGSGGSNRSWIVFEQTALATHYQVLMYLTPGGGFGSRNINVYVSYEAGFGVANGGADGTNTSRPTATDEHLRHSGTFKYLSSSNQTLVHGMQSTDGECTRIIVCQVNQATNLLIFDKLKDPLGGTPGWTNPVCGDYRTTAANSTVFTYGQYNDNARIGFPANSPLGNYLGYVTSYGDSGAAHGQNVIVANEVDNNWELSRAGFYSNNGAFYGKIGTFYDLYWCSTALANGDTFPDSGDPPEHRWAVFGNMVLPWTGIAPPEVV